MQENMIDTGKLKQIRKKSKKFSTTVDKDVGKKINVCVISGTD